MSKAVISQDEFWSIQALSSLWVDRVGPISASMWTVLVVIMVLLLKADEGNHPYRLDATGCGILWFLGLLACVGAHFFARYLQESRYHGTTVSLESSLVQQAGNLSSFESKTALFLTIGLSIGGMLVLVAIIAFIVRRKKCSNRFSIY